MTIVVYRDGVMCSDSMITNGNMATGWAEKVWKSQGWLCGASGNLEDIDKVGKWFLDPSTSEDDLPEFTDIDVLLVNPEGRTFKFQEKMKPYEIGAHYLAIGSGSHVALGALCMGASAYEAVEATCETVISCGGAIQEVHL